MTFTPPGRLTVGADGRLRGPAKITYNIPFPTGNGSWGSGAMNGVIMHTEVGYDHNVIDEFNNIKSQASATFSVNDDGGIHQYGPIGKGWYAWAQEAGNQAWYSIEHEDHGNPDTPLTDAQLTASAQLLECLSAFAGFPLQEANGPSERGYGVHYMGGAAWGGHTCPDVPPAQVRSRQRPEIISRAKAIRAGQPPVPQVLVEHVTAGQLSLVQLCAEWGAQVATVLRLTLGKSKGGLFATNLAGYINKGDLTAVMPAGISLWHFQVGA